MNDLKNKLESLLGIFWDDREIATAHAPTSLNDLSAPLDSLTACEAMIEIDDLVGKTIPVEAVIQNGGYESREEFIHLITEGVLTYLKKNG
jgi:hypothetical protein